MEPLQTSDRSRIVSAYLGTPHRRPSRLSFILFPAFPSSRLPTLIGNRNEIPLGRPEHAILASATAGCPLVFTPDMSDVVAPVKAIIKAIDTGIKLAHRVSESASSASTAKALQISESAPSLQKSLERTSQAIRDAYHQNVESCGEPFTKTLIEDSE